MEKKGLKKGNSLMEKMCITNTEKLGNHTGRLDNIESHIKDDNIIKSKIFEKMEDTNSKMNTLNLEISSLKNSFDGFKKNINENLDTFKTDIKGIFNSIFIRSMVVIGVIFIITKLLDKCIK